MFNVARLTGGWRRWFLGYSLSRVCTFPVGVLSMRRWGGEVLGAGWWEAGGGRVLPNWTGYPGRDRCSGELPERADGKVDMAGGAWEAEPGVLSDVVGVGHGGLERHAQLNYRPGAQRL